MIEATHKNRSHKGSCRNCRYFFSKFDAYGTPFNFNLPDGETKYRTMSGGIVFIILLTIGLIYAIDTFVTYFSRTEYAILNSVHHHAISSYDTFGRHNDFVIAAAFTGESSGIPVTGDPDIGELKFYMK